MSEEELEQKRAKDRERYAKLKKENKIKTVKDMTPREHRRIKKQWRIRKTRSNLNKKIAEPITAISPPNTDSEEYHPVHESLQKKRGRKAVRRDRSQCYRMLKKQEKEINKLRNKVQKYKMRLKRAKTTNEDQTNSPSPMKKVRLLVGKERISPKIKKQLFLGYALKKQLKSQV